jgi:hypothetical protein
MTTDLTMQTAPAATGWLSGPLRQAPTPGTVWLLRTCRHDGRSYGEWRWPLEAGAVVTAPDWTSAPDCGGGLHGWLRGCGAAGLAVGDTWLVIEAAAEVVVDLGEKVKVPEAVVIGVGSREAAVALMAAVYPDAPVIWAHRTAGPDGTAVTGDCGTAMIVGDGGTAVAGARGRATAGRGGSATVGYGGTATAGVGGTVAAGADGMICVRWWAGIRLRIAVGYIGEDGLEPDVRYRLDDAGRFVRVAEAAP